MRTKSRHFYQRGPESSAAAGSRRTTNAQAARIAECADKLIAVGESFGMTSDQARLFAQRGLAQACRGLNGSAAEAADLMVASVFGSVTPNATPPGRGGAFDHVLQELHNASGRLDAKRISAFFGLSLNELSTAIRRSASTLSESPDSRGLQRDLVLFERMAAALIRMSGSEENARSWFNSGNPQLEGSTPKEVVLQGEADVVADMLEDMLVGQPA